MNEMIIEKVYGLDDTYGIIIKDEKKVLILLNIDNRPKEDTYTLIHELLHLLFWKLRLPKIFHVILNKLAGFMCIRSF